MTQRATPLPELSILLVLSLYALCRATGALKADCYSMEKEMERLIKRRSNQETLTKLAVEEAEAALKERTDGCLKTVHLVAKETDNREEEIKILLQSWEKQHQKSLTTSLKHIQDAHSDFETTIMMVSKTLRNLDEDEPDPAQLKALESLLDGLFASPMPDVTIPVCAEVPSTMTMLHPNGPEPNVNTREFKAKLEDAQDTLAEAATTGDWFTARESAKYVNKATVAISQKELPTVKKLRRGFASCKNKLKVHLADVSKKRDLLLTQPLPPYHDIAALGDEMSKLEKELAAGAHCSVGGKVVYSM